MKAVLADTRASYTSPRPDVEALVPASAMRVLDIGCSNGALGASLRAAVEGRFVCGIDGSDDFCREAAARLDRVILADLNAFCWADHFQAGQFDCMIFADVLEHLVDPWKLLREAVPHLATDGLVIVSVPNIRHISALNSIFVRGTFPRISRGIFDRTHLRWFTLADLRAMLAEAGLTIDGMSQNLRISDLPHSKLNEYGGRVLRPVQRLSLVREFFTYQFVLAARRG